MSGERPLRLGFIGGAVGSAVGYAHYAATAMDGIYRLEAGAFSTHENANRESALRYGVDPVRAYTDWRGFLEAEAGLLDVVGILTPTPAHGEMVETALRAGLPVICEKALSANAAEARRLRDIERDTGGFLAVTYNYSGYPMVRELRRRIRAGALGKLVHFQADMPQEGFIRTVDGAKPTPQDWRLHDGDLPTLHLDLGVHLHHLIHYLTGLKPLALTARQGSFGHFDGLIDDVGILAQYEEGVQGNFWFSKSALGYRNGLTLRLYGTTGSAEWVQSAPEEAVIAHVDGRREILDRASPDAPTANAARYGRFKAGHPAGFVEAFANLYLDIADALDAHRTGAKHLDAKGEVFGARLAAEGLGFLEAAARAARERRWIDLGAEGEDAR